MLGTPFVVIWLVGFIADLDVDSWLIKGIMYAGVWIAVQFLSKYVLTPEDTRVTYSPVFHCNCSVTCSLMIYFLESSILKLNLFLSPLVFEWSLFIWKNKDFSFYFSVIGPSCKLDALTLVVLMWYNVNKFLWQAAGFYICSKDDFMF